MKKTLLTIVSIILIGSMAFAEDLKLKLTIDPETGILGKSINFSCQLFKDEDGRTISKAKIFIWNAEDQKLVDRVDMVIDRNTASYNFVIPDNQTVGEFKVRYLVWDRRDRIRESIDFDVIEGTDKPTDTPDGISAHLSITSYEGPSTCIKCHEGEANQMLDSVHMQWAGPTPELSNTSGESLGKAKAGINTFCTYAVSSKSACYSCHVRADGNASHEPEVNDVDCLMCHSDSYQRKFVSDPRNTEIVTDIYGKEKTYTFGFVDGEGNYVTEPDFNKMPEGITMLEVARSVHMPTRESCLRCHAKAGGGDWTKRGDMGMSSNDPDFNEDVHMSKQGADFTCTTCHAADNHKIGGRGIDLRQTEAPDPKCINCHTGTIHESASLNRHASGQVSCQVCHIREFAKGGATEMSRDWLAPVWNPAFCSGQGGYVGHEVKVANVKPDYRWFDGTSYVYNIGEKITANADGTYTMAKAHGKAFDKKSKIVPIKDHWTTIPLHQSGKIVPPVIMRMFMTGDFDQAVQEGMAEQGMTGDYTMVDANAEMLITHGVDPKSKAATCVECHDSSGNSDLMLPFSELGYHTFPAAVSNCTLCHEKENASFESMHNRHVRSERLDCNQCHTSEPVGFIKAKTDLCNDCHNYKEPEKIDELHKHHLEKGYVCGQCHEFS